jgi:hypothetical protein
MFVAVIQVTLTNVAQKSKLLWVHAIATYIISIIVMRVSLLNMRATQEIHFQGGLV